MSKLTKILDLLEQDKTIEYKDSHGITCSLYRIKSRFKDCFYIGWNCYGSSANDFNLKELKWILKVIFKIKDLRTFNYEIK